MPSDLQANVYAAGEARTSGVKRARDPLGNEALLYATPTYTDRERFLSGSPTGRGSLKQPPPKKTRNTSPTPRSQSQVAKGPQVIDKKCRTGSKPPALPASTASTSIPRPAPVRHALQAIVPSDLDNSSDEEEEEEGEEEEDIIAVAAKKGKSVVRADPQPAASAQKGAGGKRSQQGKYATAASTNAMFG